jgi:hypothetical protein
MHHAGDAAEWNDVNWTFIVRDGDSLNVDIFSGDYKPSAKFMGTFSMTAHTLMDYPTGYEGECEVSFIICFAAV